VRQSFTELYDNLLDFGSSGRNITFYTI